MQQVSRTFQANDLSQHSLVYFVNDNEKHCIRHNVPAGVDLYPHIYRYNTIDEARNQWRKIQRRLISQGYEIIK